MYKDKGRQVAASKERMRRYRERRGVTLEGVTKQGVTVSMDVTPKDCRCRHCRNNEASGGTMVLNHGSYKRADQLGVGEFNRVSLPGDGDFSVEGRRYDSRSTNVSNPSKAGVALLRHLQTHSISELEGEGYWVPTWKHKEELAGSV